MPAGAIDVDFVAEFVKLAQLKALANEAKSTSSQEIVPQPSNLSDKIPPSRVSATT